MAGMLQAMQRLAAGSIPDAHLLHVAGFDTASQQASGGAEGPSALLPQALERGGASESACSSPATPVPPLLLAYC